MWVYQQSAETKHLTVPSAVPEPAKAPAPQQTPFQKEAAAVPPSGTPVRKERLHRSRGQDLTRTCAALAASYLFGALLSGVVLALCRFSELASPPIWITGQASLCWTSRGQSGPFLGRNT